MSIPANVSAASLSPPDGRRLTEQSPSAFALLWERKVSAVCLVIVAMYLLVGLATLAPPFTAAAGRNLGPVAQGDGVEIKEFAPPSLRDFPARLLGTDIQNRSVFYRTLYGCRTALLITVFTSALSLSIGIVLGVMSGYFGGWVDEAVTWLVSTISAVPWILLVLALGFVLKDQGLGFLAHIGPHSWGFDEGGDERKFPGILVIIFSLGLTDWVGVCRLIRGEVLKQRALDYVSAAKALGLSKPRILFRHILPNCLHLVIITFTLSAVGYIQAEVALTFLGIGISDSPSWGRMIDDAKTEFLRGVWWEFAGATVAIGILSLALALLGDTLRDVLDPKTRSRR